MRHNGRVPGPTPLNQPWSTFPTEEILDDLIVEVLDSQNAEGMYAPLPPGTPHPNQSEYPGYLFLKQQAVSHDRVQRWWTTGSYQNQDLYNYDIGYSGESSSHPLFVRRYLTRRDAYAAAAGLTTFSGVWLVAVTDPGSGYDKDSPPQVSFSGGAGAGATATALVNVDGTIAWIRVTKEGTGYTSAPTVAIAAPVSGVTATATATIQATTVLLVSQNAAELPPDDPRHSLFLRVTRVYESLPGPTLTRWPFLARLRRYAKVQRRFIASSTVPADMNDVERTPGVIVEYFETDNANKSVEITTTLGTSFVWTAEDAHDYIYPATVRFAFPDEIKTSANGGVDPKFIYLGILSGSSYAADVELQVDLIDGYSGPCQGRVTERYTYDPLDAAFQAALPTITVIKPERNVVYSYMGVAGNNLIADVHAWQIPSSLHPEIEIDNADLPGFITSDGTRNIPATTPTTIADGAWIVADIQPEKLEGDLWVFRIIEVQKPDATP